MQEEAIKGLFASGGVPRRVKATKVQRSVGKGVAEMGKEKSLFSGEGGQGEEYTLQKPAFTMKFVSWNLSQKQRQSHFGSIDVSMLL